MVQQNKKNNEDFDLSGSSDEDEYELPLSANKKQKETMNKFQLSMNDPRKLQLANWEPAAQEVIQTIAECKKLAEYIKKVTGILQKCHPPLLSEKPKKIVVFETKTLEG